MRCQRGDRVGQFCSTTGPFRAEQRRPVSAGVRPALAHGSIQGVQWDTDLGGHEHDNRSRVV